MDPDTLERPRVVQSSRHHARPARMSPRAPSPRPKAPLYSPRTPRTLPSLCPVVSSPHPVAQSRDRTTVATPRRISANNTSHASVSSRTPTARNTITRVSTPLPSAHASLARPARSPRAHSARERAPPHRLFDASPPRSVKAAPQPLALLVAPVARKSRGIPHSVSSPSASPLLTRTDTAAPGLALPTGLTRQTAHVGEGERTSDMLRSPRSIDGKSPRNVSNLPRGTDSSPSSPPRSVRATPKPLALRVAPIARKSRPLPSGIPHSVSSPSPLPLLTHTDTAAPMHSPPSCLVRPTPKGSDSERTSDILRSPRSSDGKSPRDINNSPRGIDTSPCSIDKSPRSIGSSPRSIGMSPRGTGDSPRVRDAVLKLRVRRVENVAVRGEVCVAVGTYRTGWATVDARGRRASFDDTEAEARTHITTYAWAGGCRWMARVALLWRCAGVETEATSTYVTAQRGNGQEVRIALGDASVLVATVSVEQVTEEEEEAREREELQRRVEAARSRLRQLKQATQETQLVQSQVDAAKDGAVPRREYLALVCELCEVRICRAQAQMDKEALEHQVHQARRKNKKAVRWVDG